MSLEQAQDRLKNAGRNDDCPCKSGKKYKKCHLRTDEEEVSKALGEANAKAAKEAAVEEPGHEGHGHGPGEHPKSAPKVQPSGGGPKTPLSNKPQSVPRKAV